MQATQMSINRKIHDLQFTHTMDYDSAMEINQLSLRAIIWMTLTDMSKRNQIQKDTYYIMPFI